MGKTKSNNERAKRRSGKNLFWLVRNPGLHGELMLCARKPHKIVRCNRTFPVPPAGLMVWTSSHSVLYPPKEAFPEITTFSKPVPVTLVKDKKTPHMFIQRCGDNLYINSSTETYNRYISVLIFLYRTIKVTRVPHIFRISNKLFPDVTEKSGIVGVRIEKI